jgi:alkylhydroperoxidase family enzyme
MADNKNRTVHEALVTRILGGEGHASHEQRRAAFDNAGLRAPLRTLVDKVAMQPTRVTDEDIAAVKAAGLSEDQIFELVVCAAVGQATRQYDTALASLAAATSESRDRAS